jgi:hypothetical protein
MRHDIPVAQHQTQHCIIESITLQDGRKRQPPHCNHIATQHSIQPLHSTLYHYYSQCSRHYTSQTLRLYSYTVFRTSNTACLAQHTIGGTNPTLRKSCRFVPPMVAVPLHVVDMETITNQFNTSQPRHASPQVLYIPELLSHDTTPAFSSSTSLLIWDSRHCQKSEV